jgi:hypothetical protein
MSTIALLSMMEHPDMMGPLGPQRRRSGSVKTRIGFTLDQERPGKPIGGNSNKKNPSRKANKKRKKKRGYR